MNRKASRLLAATATVGPGSTVVEVGCARYPREVASDGWSTVYLARRAMRRGWRFHSVDSDAVAIATAKSCCAGLPVVFHQADGADFLLSLGELPVAVDCLFLDGGSSGFEARAQYGAAPLAGRAVVIIDDCQPIHDQPLGKASLLPRLLERDGFDVAIHDTEPGYRMLVAAREQA